MAIKSEKIVGKQIINEIESSNLTKTVYNLDKKTLVATFQKWCRIRIPRCSTQSIYQIQNGRISRKIL